MDKSIYTISDPISDEVKYVGQTQDLKLRGYQHKNANKNSKLYREFISVLVEKELPIKLDVIDVVSEKDVDFWERHYISLYKSWGFNLLNVGLGGWGGSKHSLETRKKQSQYRKRCSFVERMEGEYKKKRNL